MAFAPFMSKVVSKRFTPSFPDDDWGIAEES
jgi:hypothetical protein